MEKMKRQKTEANTEDAQHVHTLCPRLGTPSSEHACLPLLESPTRRVAGSPELNVRGRKVQGFWIGKKSSSLLSSSSFTGKGRCGERGSGRSGPISFLKRKNTMSIICTRDSPLTRNLTSKTARYTPQVASSFLVNAQNACQGMES